MRTNPFRALVLFALVLFACATGESLAPGQLFPGPLVNVRAPRSADWHLVRSGAEETVFGHQDTSTGKTYIAQVSAFRLPPFDTPDELLTIIRTGFAKDSPPDRFDIVEMNFELSTERPYPCVRVRGTSQDLKARTREGTAALPIHIRSLYCQHPRRRDVGLLIGYSQRGGPPDPDLDAQAQSFIDGVQVPQAR